jgi:hypothetical protein
VVDTDSLPRHLCSSRSIPGSSSDTGRASSATSKAKTLSLSNAEVVRLVLAYFLTIDIANVVLLDHGRHISAIV